jgi:hypothetical protein
MHIALGWFRIDGSSRYWHNGGTGGYTAYASFDVEADSAVAVLCNGPIDEASSCADNLGKHIEQRLAGEPAITLVR